MKPFESSPVVSGQTVYIGSNDFNFYAIDINTGTWQWSFPALDAIGADIGPNAAVSGSTVYVGGMDHRVYAFEGPVATITLTSTVSSTTTVPVTETSTVTTATATVSSGTTTQMQTTTQTLTSTVIASTVSVAPPGPGIPGFPIEAILMGLVGGLVALTLLGRRHRRQ